MKKIMSLVVLAITCLPAAELPAQCFGRSSFITTGVNVNVGRGGFFQRLRNRRSQVRVEVVAPAVQVVPTVSTFVSSSSFVPVSTFAVPQVVTSVGVGSYGVTGSSIAADARNLSAQLDELRAALGPLGGSVKALGQ